MKIGRVFSMGLISVICSAAFSGAAFADTYKIDPVHSSIVFRIKHLDVAYVYGRFNSPNGTMTIDEGDPSKNAVQLSVKAVDVDTGNEKRDSHLRSPDFFHTDKFGTIAFASRSFEKVGGGDTYIVKGDLSLLGVTRPIEVTARHTGSAKDPWGGFRTGFETTFSIKRTDFGMGFMLPAVGDEVVIYVSVEAVKQ